MERFKAKKPRCDDKQAKRERFPIDDQAVSQAEILAEGARNRNRHAALALPNRRSADDPRLGRAGVGASS
ncbi:hypothetical protein [Streptomyces coffeae]|uniref:Transposase n=1 Tax=Streptomyces coffeae TaxID=621382 RepID=A0ABS1NLF1_9ACTN|nr:hypothetical protein [Streptomyces coffeae]MBL1100895.1 hypothetical protein [Streptomyces coffeae]